MGAGGSPGLSYVLRLTMGFHCRRMFETAVAVGVYHKSDNSININPDEKTVFQPGDQIVVLSNTGDPPSSGYACDSCLQKNPDHKRNKEMSWSDSVLPCIAGVHQHVCAAIALCTHWLFGSWAA